MDFALPADLVAYLAELDAFIAAEIRPLEEADDNIRFFDHRREWARTDFENGGLPRHEWEMLLREASLRADKAGHWRFSAPKKYGGKDNAIKAAMKKRDEEGRKIYGEHWPYTKFSPRKVSPLNSSGEIGVSYSESDHAWVATWQENAGGQRRQRNAYFSINKYGDKKARAMAVKRRREEVAANRVAT